MNLYLVASLPHLKLGAEPALGVEAFVFSCQGQLAPDELASLERLTSPATPLEPEAVPEAAPAFEQAWRATDAQLRNTLAALRAGTRGVAEPHQALRRGASADLMAAQLARLAMAKADPLARERALDEARWQLLDGLVGVRAFSLDAVLAYGVRLVIAWRWARLCAPGAPAAGRIRLSGYLDHFTGKLEA